MDNDEQIDKTAIGTFLSILNDLGVPQSTEKVDGRLLRPRNDRGQYIVNGKAFNKPAVHPSREKIPRCPLCGHRMAKPEQVHHDNKIDPVALPKPGSITALVAAVFDSKTLPKPFTEDEVSRMRRAFAAGFSYQQTREIGGWNGGERGFIACLNITITPEAPNGYTLRRNLVPLRDGSEPHPPATKKPRRVSLMSRKHLQLIDGYLWTPELSFRDIAALMLLNHCGGDEDEGAQYRRASTMLYRIKASGYRIDKLILPVEELKPKRV